MPTATRLRDDASKCRDLASTAVTVEARDVLSGMALRYDAAAVAMEQSPRKSELAKGAFDWMYH